MPSLPSIRHGERAARLRRNRLASYLAGERMMRALARLQALVKKAGFREDQPRIPGGNGPGSGQWTYVEGYAQGRQPGIGDNGGPLLDPPEPPRDPPKDKISKTQTAKALAKEIARQALRRAGPIGGLHGDRGRTLALLGMALDPILSGRTQDTRRTPAECRQEAAGLRRPHIVEQGTHAREGFPRSMIDSADNLVGVPKYRHHEITGWYNTKNPDYGGLSPRDYLRGKSWSEHVQVGHQALRKAKVLR